MSDNEVPAKDFNVMALEENAAKLHKYFAVKCIVLVYYYKSTHEYSAICKTYYRTHLQFYLLIDHDFNISSM